MFDLEAADPFDPTGLSREHSAQGRASLARGQAGIDIQRFSALDLIVVSKQHSGFCQADINEIRNVLRSVLSGSAQTCKFLVFALNLSDTPDQTDSPDFALLIEELNDLILSVPILSIAWVKRYIKASDLELALACSMIVGESSSEFSFTSDLLTSLRFYTLLAHKLGFVQAERLMENIATVGPDELHRLLLLQSVVQPTDDPLDPIKHFVSTRMSRHNSACGIFRAQRLAMPSL